MDQKAFTITRSSNVRVNYKYSAVSYCCCLVKRACTKCQLLMGNFFLCERNNFTLIMFRTIYAYKLVYLLEYGDACGGQPSISLSRTLGGTFKFIPFPALIEKPLVQFEENVASSKEIQIRALQDKISTLTAENKNLHIKMHSISKQKSTSSQSDFSLKEQVCYDNSFRELRIPY